MFILNQNLTEQWAKSILKNFTWKFDLFHITKLQGRQGMHISLFVITYFEYIYILILAKKIPKIGVKLHQTLKKMPKLYILQIFFPKCRKLSTL